MAKKKWTIAGIVTGLAVIVFLGLDVFINRSAENKTNPEHEATEHRESPSAPSGVTIEGEKDKVREPGVYRRGPLRFINGEYVRIEGDFIPWEELEKQGIMIVRQGKLLTPMDNTSDEIIDSNYLAVENIDGMIILPDHITSIEAGTFAHCNITEIHLPENLEHIGDGAFTQCPLLKEIHIPEKVKKIDGAPLVGCDSLTRITVSEKNRWYDSREDCNAIIRTDNNRLIAGCIKTIIPDDIESVEESAYENWISRKSITQPIVHSQDNQNISQEENEIQYAKPEVESHENSKPGVYIQGHLKYVEERGLFMEDVQISWWSLEQQGIIRIKEGVLSTDVDPMEGNYLTRNYITGAVVLPEYVKTVAADTFKNCSINELIIPEGVEYIEKDSFRNCKKLTHISLPKSLKKIGRNAFSGCGIKYLQVPEEVRKIGRNAFEKIPCIEYKGTATYEKSDKYWGAEAMN